MPGTIDTASPQELMWDEIWDCREEVLKVAQSKFYTHPLCDHHSVASCLDLKKKPIHPDENLAGMLILRFDRLLIGDESALSSFAPCIEQMEKGFWRKPKKTFPKAYAWIKKNQKIIPSDSSANQVVPSTAENPATSAELPKAYWQSGLRYYQRTLAKKIKQQLSWWHGRSAKSITKYLKNCREEVTDYHAHAVKRGKIWHKFLGWWQEIDEKQKLINMDDAQQKLVAFQNHLAENAADSTSLQPSQQQETQKLEFPDECHKFGEELRSFMNRYQIALPSIRSVQSEGDNMFQPQPPLATAQQNQQHQADATPANALVQSASTQRTEYTDPSITNKSIFQAKLKSVFTYLNASFSETPEVLTSVTEKMLSTRYEEAGSSLEEKIQLEALEMQVRTNVIPQLIAFIAETQQCVRAPVTFDKLSENYESVQQLMLRSKERKDQFRGEEGVQKDANEEQCLVRNLTIDSYDAIRLLLIDKEAQLLAFPQKHFRMLEIQEKQIFESCFQLLVRNDFSIMDKAFRLRHENTLLAANSYLLNFLTNVVEKQPRLKAVKEQITKAHSRIQKSLMALWEFIDDVQRWRNNMATWQAQNRESLESLDKFSEKKATLRETKKAWQIYESLILSYRQIHQPIALTCHVQSEPFAKAGSISTRQKRQYLRCERVSEDVWKYKTGVYEEPEFNRLALGLGPGEMILLQEVTEKRWYFVGQAPSGDYVSAIEYLPPLGFINPDTMTKGKDKTLLHSREVAGFSDIELYPAAFFMASQNQTYLFNWRNQDNPNLVNDLPIRSETLQRVLQKLHEEIRIPLEKRIAFPARRISVAREKYWQQFMAVTSRQALYQDLQANILKAAARSGMAEEWQAALDPNDKSWGELVRLSDNQPQPFFVKDYANDMLTLEQQYVIWQLFKRLVGNYQNTLGESLILQRENPERAIVPYHASVQIKHSDFYKATTKLEIWFEQLSVSRDFQFNSNIVQLISLMSSHFRVKVHQFYCYFYHVLAKERQTDIRQWWLAVTNHPLIQQLYQALKTDAKEFTILSHSQLIDRTQRQFLLEEFSEAHAEIISDARHDVHDILNKVDAFFDTPSMFYTFVLRHYLSGLSSIDLFVTEQNRDIAEIRDYRDISYFAILKDWNAQNAWLQWRYAHIETCKRLLKFHFQVGVRHHARDISFDIELAQRKKIKLEQQVVGLELWVDVIDEGVEAVGKKPEWQRIFFSQNVIHHGAFVKEIFDTIEKNIKEFIDTQNQIKQFQEELRQDDGSENNDAQYGKAEHSEPVSDETNPLTRMVFRLNHERIPKDLATSKELSHQIEFFSYFLRKDEYDFSQEINKLLDLSDAERANLLNNPFPALIPVIQEAIRKKRAELRELSQEIEKSEKEFTFLEKKIAQVDYAEREIFEDVEQKKLKYANLATSDLERTIGRRSQFPEENWAGFFQELPRPSIISKTPAQLIVMHSPVISSGSSTGASSRHSTVSESATKENGHPNGECLTNGNAQVVENGNGHVKDGEKLNSNGIPKPF